MRKQILDYVIITLGLLTFTTAWVAFLIPHEIVGGGVVGASALISYVTKGLIPLEYPYFILNIILFVVGVRVLGRQFGAKTLFSIIVSSLLFRYLPLLIPQEFIEQVRREPNLLLWALVGGMLEGAGIGIAFTRGGNSGGTDIIALIVNKYKHIAPGRILLICDAIVIGSSIFLPERTVLSILYGCIMVTVATYVIDVIVVGSKQSMQILIFSEKHEQIADRIMQVIGRGVTILPAVGWYTKKTKNVILVVVRKYEAVHVYRIVKGIDNHAFLSTSSVTSVYGEGFDPIKDGKLRRKEQKKELL
ncbi:membrane protein [Bacteroidia bacterium]|nr:membrane protein [Bacteroidia bacterium]